MASVSALLFDGQARLLREVNERLGADYLGIAHVARAHWRQLGARLSRRISHLDVATHVIRYLDSIVMDRLRIEVTQALERHKSTVDYFHGHTCDTFDISDQHVTTQRALWGRSWCLVATRAVR